MQMMTGCTVRSVHLSSTQCLFLLISTPRSLQENEEIFFAALIDYPIEKEMQLLAAVRSGNFEETSELLHTILTDNVQNRRLVSTTTRLFYSSPIATVMKAYDQLRTEGGPILTENLQTLSTLQEHREPDWHVFEEILRCYAHLCNASAQSNQHKNHQVMENVQAYLENCYANPSLCLDMVAIHCGCLMQISCKQKPLRWKNQRRGV